MLYWCDRSNHDVDLAAELNDVLLTKAEMLVMMTAMIMIDAGDNDDDVDDSDACEMLMTMMMMIDDRVEESLVTSILSRL